MASGIPTISLWTDLACAGGTSIGIFRKWSTGVAKLREGDDNTLTINLAGEDPYAGELLEGLIFRCDYDDGDVEEWTLQAFEDAFPQDIISCSLVGMMAVLADRILLYEDSDSGTAAVTYTGTPAAILAELQLTPEWPAWLTPGTIDVDEVVTITLTAGNGAAAIAALRDACSAKRPVEDDPVVTRIRRVGETGYEIDLRTSVDEGPTFLEGHNLSRVAVRKDRINQRSALAPVGAANAMAGEAWFRIRYNGVAGPLAEIGIETIDGNGTPVLDDDQWNGYYLADVTGATYEILDTVKRTAGATVDKLYVSSASYPTPAQWCRLARNVAGDPLYVFPKAGAPGTPRLGFLTDASYQNRINWVYDPHLKLWSAGVPIGWSIASGTWAQELVTVETGGSAIKVTTGPSATLNGTSGGTFPGKYRAGNWVCGFRAHGKSAAGINVLFKDGATTKATLVSPASWTGTASWGTSVGTFSLTGSTDTQFNIQILANASALNPVIIDRVWIFRETVDEGDDTLSGCEAASLLTHAQRQLRATQGAAPTTYTVTFPDRYRDNPTRYPDRQVAPYRTARIIAPTKDVDTTQRIVEVTRVLDKPLVTQAQLGTMRRRLSTT